MAKAPKGKEPPKPIIVKKITVVAGGHHGGAWKVAGSGVTVIGSYGAKQ